MPTVSRIVESVSDWYRGRYIPPDNNSESGIVFLQGRYERPLLAKAFSAIGGFYLRHWQWLWGTLIAVLALLFSSPWGK